MLVGRRVLLVRPLGLIYCMSALLFSMFALFSSCILPLCICLHISYYHTEWNLIFLVRVNLEQFYKLSAVKPQSLIAIF